MSSEEELATRVRVVLSGGAGVDTVLLSSLRVLRRPSLSRGNGVLLTSDDLTRHNNEKVHQFYQSEYL